MADAERRNPEVVARVNELENDQMFHDLTGYMRERLSTVVADSMDRFRTAGYEYAATTGIISYTLVCLLAALNRKGISPEELGEMVTAEMRRLRAKQEADGDE